MKKTVKKIMSVFLCLVMLAGVAPLEYIGGAESLPSISLSAPLKKIGSFFSGISLKMQTYAVSETKCGDDACWDFDTDTGVLTISGKGDMYSYSYTSKYIDGKYYYITTAPWSEYYSDITSVVIEDGITSVGAYSFYGLTNLRSIDCGEKVEKINDYAFYQCTSLDTVEFSDSVLSIGIYAFYGCNSLAEITLPPYLEKLGQYSFYCTALSDISIPQSLSEVVYCGSSSYYHWYGPFDSSLKEFSLEEGTTKICSSLFADTGIESLVIPDTVTTVGNYSFYNCDSLKTVKLGNSVKTVGSYAFSGCGELENIDFSNSVETVSYCAFSGCSNLGNFTLPSGLTTIGADAFCNCDSLTEITIPKSLTSAGSQSHNNFEGKNYYTSGPFYGCDNLVTAAFEEGTETIASNILANTYNITDVYIPDSVKTIGSYALSSLPRVSYFSIPAGLEKIESYAFAYDTGIEEIDLPEGLLNIKSYAFYCCENLKNFTLPSTITTIGCYAFGYTDVESVEIPKETVFEHYSNYDSYCYGAFAYCSNLSYVSFEEGTTEVQPCIMSYCTGLVSVKIPDTVTSIGHGAFAQCTNLTEVKLSNALTDIGSYSFYNCNSLPSVVMGNYVKSVGKAAFCNCSNLSYVSLSSRLYSLGSSAFAYCTSLEEIAIPKSLKSTGYNASWTYSLDNVSHDHSYCYDTPFYGCSSLKSVKFEYGATSITGGIFAYCSSLSDVSVPETVTEISQYAFFKCPSLEEIVLPDNITEIGDGAFAECSSLKNINIPSALLSIGNFAFCSTEISGFVASDCLNSIGTRCFQLCGSLESVRLNSKITTIGDYTFNNCDSLKNVYIPASVTKMNVGVFYDCDSLADIIIPNSVTAIGTYCFYSCNSLKNVTLSNNLKIIDSYTFSHLQSLEEIVLPKSVTTIKAGAFDNSPKLRRIVIPVSVTSIDSSAFSYADRMVIEGVAGSYAQTFANANDYTFLDITNHITGLKLKDDDNIIYMNRGTYYTPEFEIEPADNTDLIVYTSDNTQAAYIVDGKIYANYNGTATITATTSGGLTYDFTVVVKTVKSVAITAEPEKKSYAYGEELDLTGLELTATYTDSSTAVVSGYTVSGYYPTTYGTQTVTITYSGYTAKFDVEVVDDRVFTESIAVTVLPDKTEYKEGEILDLTGMVVTAYYSDGTTAEITDYTVSAMNSLLSGEQTLTVSYQGAETYFNIRVTEVYVTSIEVATMPDKTVYYVGDKFDSAGLVVTAHFSDDSSRNYSEGYSCSGFSSVSAGEKTIKVTFGGKSTEFGITVEQKYYTITFVVDGETVSEASYAAGDRVKAPSIPSKEGYRSAGWSPYTPTTMPAYDVTFTAVYKVNSYDVTYKLNEGTINNSGSDVVIEADYGEVVPVPESNPVKEGYIFTGWISDYEGLTVPAKNITYIAQWKLDDSYHWHTPKTVIVGATCTESGYSYSECAVCGEKLSSYEPVAPLGHIYDEVITIPATCEGSGYVYQVCSRCGEMTNGAEIPALDHDYSSYSYSKTAGAIVSACSNCGAEGDTLETASYTEGLEYLVWNYDEAGNAVITGCKDDAAGRIVIPDRIGSAKVTSIEYGAFSDLPDITEIDIPSTVTKLDAGTFISLTGLEKVSLPDGISVDENAFAGCGDFGISCTIGSDWYSYCTSNGKKYVLVDEAKKTEFVIKNQTLLSYNGTADDIVLPPAITSVSGNAFRGNGNVRKIEIPYCVSQISNSAFTGCSSLESVIIPYTVTSIAKNAFDGTDAEIICYYNSYANSYAVENNIPYELITVKFASDNISLRTASTANVMATPSVKTASGIPMIFESTDTSVATVDESGNVTAVNAGTAKINVYSENHNYLGTCSVTAVGKEDNILSGVTISVPGDKKIGWKFKAKITATADVPSGYHIVWYEGDTIVSDSSTFTTGSLKSAHTYTAKIADSNGKIVSADSQNKSVTVSVKTGFFDKIISFFQRLFGNDTTII